MALLLGVFLLLAGLVLCVNVLHFIPRFGKKLEEFAREHFRGHPRCTPRVLLGDIAEEILNYAESEKMDLIIIGTHGRKGLERVYFGSIAERVIKMSPTPVLSINPYRVKAQPDMDAGGSRNLREGA